MDKVNWLLTVNVATLCTVLAFGFRVIRFINLIEFRVDLMWMDYQTRETRRRDDDGA